LLTTGGVSDDVDVSLVFDSIPDMGRHRITLSNADGAVCWFSAGLMPVTLQFPSGELLFAHASVAARRGAASKTRPARNWRLQVERGRTAVLCLGTRDPFRPLDRLEIRIEGARVRR
jgi:hypothetical protein